MSASAEMFKQLRCRHPKKNETIFKTIALDESEKVRKFKPIAFDVNRAPVLTTPNGRIQWHELMFWNVSPVNCVETIEIGRFEM